MPEPTADTGVLKSMPSVSSHDRILLSAKRLFARNGYENTSTVAIAREAGTSESQLMKHFGSKQGLLLAIFDRGWANIIERVQVAPRKASPTDRLLGVLEAMIIEVDNDPDLKELMALESRRVRKDNHDVLMSGGYQQFTGIVDGLLSEMRSQGHIHPNVNLQAVRAAILGMTEGLLRDQVVAKRSECRADYNFDDIRKVLQTMIPALGGEAVQPLKAVNR
ncbi:MAG: TetR/AcrR family transcriptional regulator [Candidatus Korobacteraceae bacterium]|jgi:AcrR family transcriptional regulator